MCREHTAFEEIVQYFRKHRLTRLSKVPVFVTSAIFCCLVMIIPDKHCMPSNRAARLDCHAQSRCAPSGKETADGDTLLLTLYAQQETIYPSVTSERPVLRQVRNDR